MSNCVLNRTFDRSQQKNAHRLALIALADRADDEGLCDPGFKDIAKRAGVSERQAKRLVAQLEESGELYIGHGGGRKSTNLYFITIGLSLEQIEATLKKHFNLGDRTAATAQVVYARIEGAGLYVPKYEEKGVTRGRNSVTDDTVSRSQNGDIQGVNAPSNGVTDDTVYTNDDGNGVIQGQETVSSIPPEPLTNLLDDSPIESKKQQQPKTRMPAQEKPVVVGVVDDLSDMPDLKAKADKRKGDADFGTVTESYASEIGNLSPIVADMIWDDLQDHPVSWLLLGIKEAVKANVRRWDYVQGCLKNWQAQGGPQNGRPRQNGHSPPTSSPPDPALTEALKTFVPPNQR